MQTSGEATNPASCGCDRHPSARSSLFSCQRILWLTVLLLVVVTLMAGLELAGVVHPVSANERIVTCAACGMLISLAICMLLLGRYITQRTLQHIELQLRALARDDRCLEQFDAPVPDDLRPVMSALIDYVAQVRARVKLLHQEQHELDVQIRTVDAEKRHTEAILYSISDAVLAVDPAGRLTLANIAAERMFGFRLNRCRSQPISEIITDASLAAMLADARAMEEQRRRCEMEYSLNLAGKSHTFKITLSTVVDSRGQSRGRVAVFHDITRDREIAQLKTDFVSAVSHELRTPLSSIQAYVEMLVDGEAHDETERREFYRIIESETDRLQRLISNILNISRIESGALPIHRESVQINDVVREVIATLTPQADEKAIALLFEATGSPPEIRADRDLMQQAIMNVVGNAIKYTPRHGQVAVTTAFDSEASRLVVTVADNGMGMRSEDLPRIFDKFYRTRESADVAKGTGLGLNLVRNIVETVHQGEVAVASEYGRGTTMTLRLPVQPVEEPVS